MGRKTPKGPKQRERARARHDSVFGSSPHILDAAERLFHQERATLRGAGMCRYEPETLQIAGAHLQAAWRNSFHAAENPFLQVLPRTPKIAPIAALLQPLPLAHRHRARQGRLGSNFQPGIRNCIAVASSRARPMDLYKSSARSIASGSRSTPRPARSGTVMELSSPNWIGRRQIF